MKKIISLIVLFAVIFECTIVGGSTIIEGQSEREKDMNTQMEDAFSKSVLQNALFEKHKVLDCKNLSDAIDVTGQLIKSNSIKMNSCEDELFVENCVIVQSSQEIAFNTEEVISAVHYEDMYYIQYETVKAAEEAVSSLEQYPSVIYAVTDEIVVLDDERIAIAEEYSPLYGKDGYTHHSWGISQTGLDIFADYVSRNATGSVDVAVIDSGVDASHSFLQGHISGIQYDLVDQDSIANDPRGHGTFVAGIIVDAMQKLNFSIIPVRVIDINGESSVFRIAQGINQAVAAGADVINLSLGKKSLTDNHSPIDVAITSAIEKNVVVVVSAGNNDASTATKCPAHLYEPIVVSGIDKVGNRYINSNYGSSVDVTAPAVDVKSCAIPSSSSTGYSISTGTSYATPHVTAAAAMLRLLYPSDTPSVIHTKIKTYTDDVGSAGTDVYFGNGLMKISNRIITVPFSDVSKNSYYYNGVYSGYGRGYISGLTSTTFGPTENMQRQDVAVVLYKMAGAPYVTYDQQYSDVSSTDYFAKAVTWASDNDILYGFENGRLGVGQPITREDFAVVLCRYAQYRGLNTTYERSVYNYHDGYLVSAYARDAVAWAGENKIMGNDGRIYPQDNIIRADIAVMIYGFLCL